MLHEFREFCEDNNVAPPAPLRAAPARTGLTFWSAADPALEVELSSLKLGGDRPGARALYFQRVFEQIRYELVDGAGAEVERGTVRDLRMALDLADAWLGGDPYERLRVGRSVVV